MDAIAFVVRAISAINIAIGRVFAWLSLGIVLVCFTVVVQRYLFSVSFVWMQDLYIWLNGAMFTAVAGFALQRDDHVRVDIFYRPASLRRKAVIDLIGVVLFLLPFMGVVFVYGLPFVTRAWSYHEASANVGGMPGLFILKTSSSPSPRSSPCRARRSRCARSSCWADERICCPCTCATRPTRTCRARRPSRWDLSFWARCSPA